MKATGIVRRIDELGRVVIPKEIRRTLRIREGDPLEIFTDREGEIILKKYSPIGELNEFAREYASAIHQSLGHIAAICDKDAIITAAGANKRELADKSIHEQVERLMQERARTLANAAEGETLPKITADEEGESPYTAAAIAPIIAAGDAIGAVLLLSREPGVRMGETEAKVVETAAGFLGKQMEQ